MNPLRVQPFGATTLDNFTADLHYDAIVGSLGFETRCSQIPRSIDRQEAAYRAAVPFSTRRCLAFDENEAYYSKLGWDIPSLESDDQAVEWLGDWVTAIAADPAVKRLAVDVSSMSRTRIAAVIERLVEAAPRGLLDVDFLYTPAEFRPPTSPDPPVLSVGPVSGYFAGWWSDLETPLHAIIGIGYELECASSAIDHLEPESAEIWLPVGTDDRYLEEVEQANQALLAVSSVESQIRYAVQDPFSFFRKLEARVHAYEARRRLALVPLGPKIFAACSLLVGALHTQSVQVVRVTAGERQEAVDCESDGNVYGLTLSLGQVDEIRPSAQPARARDADSS